MDSGVGTITNKNGIVMDIKLEMEQCDINIKPLSDSMIIVLTRLHEEKVMRDGSFINGCTRWIVTSVLDDILRKHNCYLCYEPGNGVFLMNGNFKEGVKIYMSDAMKEDIIDAYDKSTMEQWGITQEILNKL